MSEWKTVTLGEVANVVTGTTPPGTLPDNWGYEIPFLTPSDLSGADYMPVADRHLSVAAADRHRGRVVQDPAVAVVCIGATIGKVALIKTPTLTNQQINTLIPLEGAADARFLYYRMQLERDRLQAVASGSATPIISKGAFSTLDIDIPAFDVQVRIAAVLGAIDDLIETERSLAEAAIALVNAEFTRRFGDRPLSIDAGSLGTVIDCLHSKKPELVSGGRTLMQLNNIREDGLVDRGPSYGVSDSDYATWSRKLETRPWDLVITNVGRIGAVARIPDDYAVAIGRNMTALRPALPELDGAFLIASFLSSAVRSEIDARTDAGTVMSALNVRSIPRLRLQDSTPEERTAFHQVAAPLLREADASLASILDLSQARDELLPLLMSGKVRVAEDMAVA